MGLDDAEQESQLRETLHRAAAPVHGEGVDKDAIRNQVARRQASRTRARWTGRTLLATAVAVAAAVVAFLLVDPGRNDVETDDGLPPATQSTAPPTTETPSTAPSTTATTDTPSTTPTTTAPAEPTLPEFPPTVTGLTQGGTTWALYLAIVPESDRSRGQALGEEPDSPAFVAARAALAQAGYPEGTGGTLNCDQGAAETLGVDPASYSSVVYFETEAQAKQAKAAFEARDIQPVGIAHVTTYCLD